MTEMPIEHAAHAALAPHPTGVADRLRELREALPVVALITATPQARQLTAALARAVAAGVPEAEMEGLIAGLHGLAHRAEGLARNGSGPQPVIAPVPDHDHDRSM